MSPNPESPCWVLTGPTASGKSNLAIELATREDLEIVSMDSMAIYRRMDIGTAKPSAAERSAVRHHLIDVVDPDESYDAGRYCEAAAAADAAIRARGRRPLFVGGTTLYLMTYFKGLLSGPAADPQLRAALSAREDTEPGSLHRELSSLDPDAAGRIHQHDRKRLIRALEVQHHTGRPISAQQNSFDRPGWRVPCRILAISRPRDELHDRVKQRTRLMLAAGLVEECREIRDDCGFSLQAAAAIGYAESLRYLDGGFKDEEELRNRIRRSTHRLIRRQATWLRRIPEVTWLDPNASAETALTHLRVDRSA